MKRRAFIQTLGAAAAGAGGLRLHPRMMIAKRLDRIGLELYAVRHEMAKDPEKTLAAIRAIGYTDVELLWSFDNFHRTAAQVADSLKQTGLRAPSAHISPIILLDGWREWADRFNAAGAVARKAGIWLAFHNEANHMKAMDGMIPYDVFVDRLDPSVVRLQLDTGNMLIGGGDPMRYLEKYRDRYWS